MFSRSVATAAFLGALFLASSLSTAQFTQARDMAKEDLEVPEDQAIDEDMVDPARAMAIAKEKMGLIGPGAIIPRHAGCGIVPRDRDNTVTRDAASPNAARQRSGSSTSCRTNGVLQPSDDAEYYCYTVGNDRYTWTYLHNRRTAVRGWTRDDLLRDNGSFVYCGF